MCGARSEWRIPRLESSIRVARVFDATLPSSLLVFIYDNDDDDDDDGETD